MTKTNFWGSKLNPDGSEVVDTSVISVPLRVGKSAEQKLKEMLERELQRRELAEETELDGLDFELPLENPPVHGSVLINAPSAKVIKEKIREQKLKAKQKAADDAAAERAKGPAGGPKQVANDSSRKSAQPMAATEGADEESDD